MVSEDRIKIYTMLKSITKNFTKSISNKRTTKVEEILFTFENSHPIILVIKQLFYKLKIQTLVFSFI